MLTKQLQKRVSGEQHRISACCLETTYSMPASWQSPLTNKQRKGIALHQFLHSKCPFICCQLFGLIFHLQRFPICQYNLLYQRNNANIALVLAVNTGKWKTYKKVLLASLQYSLAYGMPTAPLSDLLELIIGFAYQFPWWWHRCALKVRLSHQSTM